MKGERLVEVQGDAGYSVYKKVPTPCVPLGVDQGGYCCTEIPEAIQRLKRKKVGDKMWVTMQYQQSYGMFKAVLSELIWNKDKTKVSARFSGDILDKVSGSWARPL